MDVSVLAAVGSFAVSERILKPKATVLVILGCILCYDLTTKTHDTSSLRVYRGPALLAFTLMCCAYSLRTWRRNGVACDELLFLPGTLHGQSHGIDSPPVEDTGNLSSGRSLTDRSANRNEGDAAAGLGVSTGAVEEFAPMLQRSGQASSLSTNNSVQPLTQPESSLEMHIVEDEGAAVADDAVGLRSFDSWEDDDEEMYQRGSVNSGDDALTSNDEASADDPQSRLDRFAENHPGIAGIGTFFFFRSSSSSTDNATYAPSGPAVFGAALDLCMPILFNFHLFIEAYNHITPEPGSENMAKILPLIFLTVLIVRSFIPPSRRKRFWSTIKVTAMAPFYKVRFRDAFIGDVLTSLVRPIQDVLFALSYYMTVMYGTLFGSYSLAEAGLILERSWLLHNVILPSCALLPLWWKFLQTLRQSYDANRRWLYLGDAFKYLSAAMVIIYGMTHPEEGRSPWWLVCYILVTVYQIAWDTIVDWELFVITPRADGQLWECESPWCTTISSLRPSSYILLTMQMYILQPISDCIRKISANIPSWEQIQLRPKRLYKRDHFYYRIFIVNVILRFTWMLCFIPAYRLSSVSDGTKETLFLSDVNSYVGVLLPVAEIIRRCYWGFLKLEMETIRMMDADTLYSRVADNADEDPSEKERSSTFRQCLPTWLDVQQKQQHDAATSGSRSKVGQLFQCSDTFLRRVLLVELSVWAIAFVGFGYLASC